MSVPFHRCCVIMESKRVYVGGLYHEVSEKDLRQLFTKFGDVESIEIKKRSENNVVNFVFAYVNIKTTDPQITQRKYLQGSCVYVLGCRAVKL